MELIRLLKGLYQYKRISRQQFQTYRGQVYSGDGKGCVAGLQRKNLISEATAQRLIESME